MTLSSSFESIAQQWENMLNSGKIPCFEFELKNDEYLLVDLELLEVKNSCKIHPEYEIVFSFDSMDLKTWFSGNVKQYHDCKFAVSIDEYSENLDELLELIHSEIMEGFIVPNDLLPRE